MFDREEFERWLKQAEKTLESAERDKNNEDYNWCCFKAQQAAEYAVKVSYTVLESWLMVIQS